MESELSRSAPIPHKDKPSGEKASLLTAPDKDVGRMQICCGARSKVGGEGGGRIHGHEGKRGETINGTSWPS